MAHRGKRLAQRASRVPPPACSSDITLASGQHVRSDCTGYALYVAAPMQFKIDPAVREQLAALQPRPTRSDAIRSALRNAQALEALKPGWLMERTETGDLYLVPPLPDRPESPRDSPRAWTYWPEERIANEATIVGFGMALGALVSGHLGSAIGGATAFAWNTLRRRRP
jgi:hypothetical protein